MAAGLAAKSIEPKQLRLLEDYLKEEIRIFENRDLDEYYRVNDAIHLIIAEASGNKVLVQYIEAPLNRTKIYLILYDPFYSMPINPSIHEHRHLVEALASRKVKQAEKAMKIHINSAFEGMDIQPPEDYISL